MPNPQQPELRRNDKGAATPEDSRQMKAAQPDGTGGGTPHGTDKGEKGGGEGGGVPPAQQPDHP
ncbi:hypothetical protein ACH4C6_05540 [Streptomyces sp. NPDC017943]|uniref:hypothetical protein n=1 Tax=Streptomyces sp. NPDC017943 TaxID=3365019 RepID=UPI0037BB80D4